MRVGAGRLLDSKSVASPLVSNGGVFIFFIFSDPGTFQRLRIGGAAPIPEVGTSEGADKWVWIDERNQERRHLLKSSDIPRGFREGK